MEITSTFKQRKLQLQKEGFDPSAIADPLWLRESQSGTYVQLTPDLYRSICDGQVKL
jgi:fatty-acyl-CoA synthase